MPLRGARDQVAHQVRSWIIDGVLQVGEEIPSELVLSHRFATSRETVHEALTDLARERLLDIHVKGGGGTVVAPDVPHIVNTLTGRLALLEQIDELDHREFSEVRLSIESSAAGLAATNRDESQLHCLASYHNPTSIHHGTLADLAIAFHSQVVLAAGNRLLGMLIRPLLDASSRGMRDAAPDRQQWTQVAQAHNSVYRAIQSQDPIAASAAMTQHLRDARSWCAARDRDEP